MIWKAGWPIYLFTFTKPYCFTLADLPIMTYCSAVGCVNNSSKKCIGKDGKNVTLHAFPLQDAAILKDYRPTEHSKICSEHFHETDFDYQPFTGTLW